MIGVGIAPGWTLLQRIPYPDFAQCNATDFVIRVTAAFTALYTTNSGSALNPAAEAMLIIDPPCLVKIGKAVW